MASQAIIKVNAAGVAALLKSEAVRSDLLRRAEAIQQNAGDGYVATSAIGHDRAYAIVRTDTMEARRDEAMNHTLLRSLHAGGSW
jgi:hypothetical protein